MSGGQFMRNLSVLVVDDHRFMQQVMRVMLSGLGVRDITSALSVDEALRQLSYRKVDIVIADYKIGGQSGAEFIRLTRTQRADGARYVPIIACTADTTPKAVREMRDSGADEILCKPVSARALASRIMAVTSARRNFVSTNTFFGPDRRRRQSSPKNTAERRASDFQGA